MATDSKKDLTGLMDYAKKLEESGDAPPIPEGLVMEEIAPEKVEQFESLDDYGKSHPAPDPMPDPVSEPIPEPIPMPEVSAFAIAKPDLDAATFAGAIEPPPGTPSESEFVISADPELTSAPMDSPLDSGDQISIAPSSLETPLQPEIAEPLRPSPQAPRTIEAPLEKVREYSEQLSPGKSSVPASFPFSLIVTGRLAPEEKERLLDLISRENMGIREIDLEPQFESGKILIPRISEYAGILILSALRSAAVKLRFGPSDSIFATEDTQDTNAGVSFDSGLGQSASRSSSDGSHPAEELPITTEAALPGQVQHAMTQLIDVVTASAALKTSSVEAEHSPEYQMLLETLQRELKYKAFHKGATAIVSFSVQLTSLRQPTHYRVMVTGAAIKT
jgi:hypothetical protein